MTLDNYFRLDSLEKDPVKLVEWLTDYDTQKLVAHYFETDQVFYKDDDDVMVYKGLKSYYDLYFDTKNTLLDLELDELFI